MRFSVRFGGVKRVTGVPSETWLSRSIISSSWSRWRIRSPTTFGSGNTVWKQYVTRWSLAHNLTYRQIVFRCFLKFFQFLLQQCRFRLEAYVWFFELVKNVRKKQRVIQISTSEIFRWSSFNSISSFRFLTLKSLFFRLAQDWANLKSLISSSLSRIFWRRRSLSLAWSWNPRRSFFFSSIIPWRDLIYHERLFSTDDRFSWIIKRASFNRKRYLRLTWIMAWNCLRSSSFLKPKPYTLQGSGVFNWTNFDEVQATIVAACNGISSDYGWPIFTETPEERPKKISPISYQFACIRNAYILSFNNNV